MSAFETAYNAGCIHIARNEYPQGVMLLKKARGGYDPMMVLGTWTGSGNGDRCANEWPVVGVVGRLM